MKKATRDAFHVPDIPIDLIPPQVIMRNNKDGWFRTNGAKAVLTFADGMEVDVGFDPVTRFPMIHMFDDADSIVELPQQAREETKEEVKTMSCVFYELH